ncbi:MAG: hypothetical protein HN584_07385 [Akkermansiaceae bacterium]|jgi:hypothetical protein|nr:hypothetical protein [Akkermansiaceae bacterium]MDG1854297.1 hypothetical protein [Verrucomicrobiales bacterium]
MSDGEQEGVEDDPVISPIASALGYSREKKELGDENANPIAKQIASNEPDDEILDLSLLESSQPFEEDSYQNEEKGSYVFAIIVMVIAIGAAAVLAHVSGKAAWLQ